MKTHTQKKILVTGASGMTGSALVLRLAEQGHNVVAFSRGSNPVFKSHPNVSWCPGDIQDRAVLDTAMQGTDEVYHLAAIATHWAPDLREFYRTNVIGTLNVLESARTANVRRVVITSSVGVIGPPDPDNLEPITENNVRTVAFFNDYEASKSILHERVQDYVRAGMDIVLVLPARVWGPAKLDTKNSVLYLLHRYHQKKAVMIPGTGKQVGNFVYVDDVVDGHLLAMEKGRSGERYFIGGHNLSMDDVAKHFQRFRNRPARVMHVPFRLIRVLASVESLLAKWFKRPPISTQTTITKLGYHCPVSSEKAIRELGYSPMPFDKSLDLAWAWLEAGGKQWPVPQSAALASTDKIPTLAMRSAK